MEGGRRRIAPLISEFTARYPGISAELILTDKGLDVVEEEMDVALHVTPPPSSNIVSRVVLTTCRIVCASPEYAAAHNVIKRPVDLLDHDCIRLVRRPGQIYDEWPFKENGRVTHVRVGGSLTTSSGEVMHDWALAGRAVARKLLWDVEEDVKAGRLIRFLEPHECDEVKLHLTYPSRSYLPPRVRLFIDFIVSSLQTPEEKGGCLKPAKRC